MLLMVYMLEIGKQIDIKSTKHYSYQFLSNLCKVRIRLEHNICCMKSLTLLFCFKFHQIQFVTYSLINNK